MTPKILYHLKPGTTNFFYGDFPEEPMMGKCSTKPSCNESNCLCDKEWLPYYKALQLCKEEAIKNGEIVNPELFNVHIPYFGTGLKPGDTFDLPKGLKVEKFEQCIECGADLHEDCKNGPDGCDVKNRWFIRLVPDVEEQSNAKGDYILYQPIEDGIIGTHFGNSKEESQEELFRQIIEIFNKEHIKYGRPDYSELKSKFIIKAIDSIDLNKKP